MIVVYTSSLPSTASAGPFSNIEGVIHGSRTNQPPKFTPRTFSCPNPNFRSRLSKADTKPAGAAFPRVASSPTAAVARFRTPMVLSTIRSMLLGSDLKKCYDIDNEDTDDNQEALPGARRGRRPRSTRMKYNVGATSTRDDRCLCTDKQDSLVQQRVYATAKITQLGFRRTWVLAFRSYLLGVGATTEILALSLVTNPHYAIQGREVVVRAVDLPEKAR